MSSEAAERIRRRNQESCAYEIFPPEAVRQLLSDIDAQASRIAVLEKQVMSLRGEVLELACAYTDLDASGEEAKDALIEGRELLAQLYTGLQLRGTECGVHVDRFLTRVNASGDVWDIDV